MNKKAGLKWSDKDIEYLKEHWGNCSLKYLARMLSRTVNSIKIKAFRLGLIRMIHSGDYITFNQLMVMIYSNDWGGNHNSLFKKDFPIETITIINKKVKIVYMEKFWSWFEKNKHVIDLKNTDNTTFGYEPEWVKEKRKADKLFSLYKKIPWTKDEDKMLLNLLSQYKYSYREISIKLRRTEGAIKRRCRDLKTSMRPLKADNHTPWTDKEISLVKDMYLKGYKPDIIAEYINRSALAINGLLERNDYFNYE